MRYALVVAVVLVGSVIGVVSVADGKRKHPPFPPPTTTTTPEPPPPPPGPAVKRVAVVLINFTNDTSQPWTTEEARTIAFDGPGSTAAFFVEASYGKQTIAGDVYGWWTVPYTNSPCDTLAWKNAARARALEQGVNLDTDYDIVSLVWPRTTACGFNSRAGTFHNGDFDVYAHAHEMGHSFNMNHANRWACTDSAGVPVALSTTCTEGEYGDIFSVMGASLRPFNGWEKIRLGWLENYQVVSQPGTYTLAPLGAASPSQPQTLLIPRSDGTVFALEQRQRGPFEPGNADDFKFHGVLVRVATEMPWLRTQNAQAFLIDTHPGGTLARFDAPLAVGETLTDPLGGISFTVMSVGPSGAVVDVVIGG